MAREALGKGLEALFEGVDVAADAEFMHLRIDRIRPNPYQPRQRFNAAALQELADSINQQGLVQPIVVRRHDDGFELVVGERRLRAVKLLDFNMIPALVKRIDEREMLEFALLENLQREDLNPMEEARAYHRLQTEFHLRQGDIAQRVGKDRSSIANTLRLLQLPSLLQADVEAGRLSMGHARALLALKTEAAQRRLRDQVVADNLSVRDTEERVQRQRKPTVRAKPSHLLAAEDSLKRYLETRVTIRPGRRSGKIEITYRGEADLQRLLDLLQTSSTSHVCSP